jgi:hypothetical protein
MEEEKQNNKGKIYIRNICWGRRDANQTPNKISIRQRKAKRNDYEYVYAAWRPALCPGD